MTQTQPTPTRRRDLTTARLMGIVALWALLLGIAFQPTPAAFQHDHVHFGIYKLIAAFVVCLPLVSMLREHFGKPEQPAKAQPENGKRADEELI